MQKNLLKEMQSTLEKRKQNNEKNSVITEVNKLLEYDNVKDTNILRSIGSNSTLVQSENERGAIIEIEKKEKFYSGIIFTYEQIEDIATRYRLKFLPSSKFSSYIDPLVALDVKELERSIAKSMEVEQAAKRNMSLEDYIAEHGNNKFEFDNNDLKNKFYILAPGKCFKTEKVSVFATKAPDPILFYRIDDNHFRLIRKWGKDFTIFRRLLGVLFKNRRSLYWSMAFAILSISVLVSIVFVWDFMLLNILSLIAIPCVYAVDWHSEFFGKRYTKSSFTY